jgi:hypothetical protein
MKNKFSIYSGDVSFENDYLQINDGHPKWTKLITILGSVCAIIYGLINILEYHSMYHSFKLWMGSALVLLGIPALVTQAKLTYDKKIYFDNIEKIRIKTNLANQLIADLFLQNGKKRRILLDQQNFVKFELSYLNDFVKALNDKNKLTEIR